MSVDELGRVSNMLSLDTFKSLKNAENTYLVDVRTREEWSFVGIPDLTCCKNELILLEWAKYPSMQLNESFVDNLMEKVSFRVASGIFFICRSGARSFDAASEVFRKLTNLGFGPDCINVINGFEGDLDKNQCRGKKNGWKAQGLPWYQS